MNPTFFPASSPDAKELTIDYLAELKRNRNNSKQKKKLLEQKRKVLMKALDDLKELILESESAKARTAKTSEVLSGN